MVSGRHSCLNSIALGGQASFRSTSESNPFLICNHTIVHSRSAYEDGPVKRHLLRLWLSLENDAGWARRRSWLETVGRLARERWRQRGESLS